MHIGVYNLVSPVHDSAVIDKSLADFIGGIEKSLGSGLVAIPLSEVEKAPISIIFVKSGGTEYEFKKIYERIKPPYFLLTTNLHNSLPAAMEILAFIRAKGLRGEIIHGSASQAAARLKTIKAVFDAKSSFKKMKLGVMGNPSDWLIASSVDYKAVKKLFGIELVDIPMKEVLAEIKKGHDVNSPKEIEILKKGFKPEALKGALNIYESLKALCERHNLKGFTLRCFDLLDSVKNTGCLGLSLLNGEGFVAGCEGDIPAMLSMLILKTLSKKQVFMANPSSIDAGENSVVMAHCTVPLDMTASYKFESHFESRIGVGIKGLIPEGEGTIFKLSSNLKEFFVSPAVITKNLDLENLCRTQIEVKVGRGTDYFLKNPYGNHHIICNGDHTTVVEEFFR
ncbi:MAG TPA: hypothetical protein PKK26_03600 [Candidatus Wallbacteria bacterium]|nr:hypothetical protein [Candidatus Wallbacteria bacterium]